MTIRAGDLELVLPGPNSSEVRSRDSTEPYFYTVNRGTFGSFFSDYGNLSQAERDGTTITLSDGESRTAPTVDVEGVAIRTAEVAYTAGSPLVSASIRINRGAEIDYRAGIPIVEIDTFTPKNFGMATAEAGVPTFSINLPLLPSEDTGIGIQASRRRRKRRSRDPGIIRTVYGELMSTTSDVARWSEPTSIYGESRYS